MAAHHGPGLCSRCEQFSPRRQLGVCVPACPEVDCSAPTPLVVADAVRLRAALERLTSGVLAVIRRTDAPGQTPRSLPEMATLVASELRVIDGALESALRESEEALGATYDPARREWSALDADEAVRS